MKKEILVILTVLAALQLPSAANILNGFEKIEAIPEVKTQSSADTLSEFRNIELQWLTAVKNSPKAALTFRGFGGWLSPTLYCQGCSSQRWDTAISQAIFMVTGL